MLVLLIASLGSNKLRPRDELMDVSLKCSFFCLFQRKFHNVVDAFWNLWQFESDTFFVL